MSLQAQIHSIMSDLKRRLSDALNEIPGYAGQACGIAVGSLQVAVMLKALLLQDILKLRTAEGRSEVWHGHKGSKSNGMAGPDDQDLIKAADSKSSIYEQLEVFSEETIKAAGLPSLKILKDITNSKTNNSNMNPDHANASTGSEQPFSKSQGEANASASSIAMTPTSSVLDSGAFSPNDVLSPKSPMSPSFTLTDAAAEEQLKALDVSLPPRVAKPKGLPGLPESKVAGEHQSSWDLLQTPRNDNEPKPNVIYESALPTPSQESHVDDIVSSQQSIRSMPVVYESDYSLDSPVSEHPQEPKSAAASPSGKSLSQHAEVAKTSNIEKTAAPESPPGKQGKPEISPAPPVTPQQAAPRSPHSSVVASTVRVIPRSMPTTASSTSSSRSSSSTGEITKQKKKGVQGAFRKMKKILSNK